MPIVSLSTRVDKEEYSKFEVDNDLVSVTIIPTYTPGNYTEDVVVQLMKARRDRDFVVDSTTHTLTFTSVGTGGDVTSTVTIDLKSLIDVSDPKLTAGFSKIRRGGYFIKVYSALNNAVEAESSDFDINIITVASFKRDYLFGLELSAHDIRKVKNQPVQYGVEITEISRNHSLGFFPLTFNRSGGNKMVSWGKKGPLININSNGTYTIPDLKKTSYITLRVVDVNLVPTVHTVIDILVEKDEMDLQTIRNFIVKATDWLEFSALHVFLEPTRIISDPNGRWGTQFPDQDHDHSGNAMVLYPRTTGHWLGIQFPYPSLLKISRLFGAINHQLVIEINSAWMEISEKTGFVQLVPFSQRFGFQFVGLMWVETVRGPVPVPNFWHYDIIAGLRDCPGELREAIAKKAAIETLIVAGQAFKSVIGSQRIGRDGVYEAVNYFNPGKGLYGSTIQTYQEHLDATIDKYKHKYRGMDLWVL